LIQKDKNRSGGIQVPQSCLDWLHTLAVEVPADLDESACRRLLLPPGPGVYSLLEPARRIVIHHSASDDGNASLFRLLHRAVFGWADVGYHYVIGNGTWSPDGFVETGRPAGAAGAHARGHNSDSIGICLVGNFENWDPTPAQIESLSSLLLELILEAGLSRDDVFLHRELPGMKTACPGRNFTRDLLEKLLDRRTEAQG
jgi:N-acetylmuramoyl-L-alanine amidase